MARVLFVFAVLGCATSSPSSPRTLRVNLTDETRLELPTRPVGNGFEENRGQLPRLAAFRSEHGRQTVWISNDGSVTHDLDRGDTRDSLVFRFQSQAHMEPRGLNPKLHRTNYFVGADASRWLTDVRRFDTVEIPSVWPSIDVRLEDRVEGVEQVYLVHPGAAPNSIAVEVEDCRDLAIEPDGRLAISLAGDVLYLGAPVAYQPNHGAPVSRSVHYRRLSRCVYGFTLDHYDSQDVLVIDPILQSTNLDGDAGYAPIAAVAIAANGDVIVARNSSMDYAGTLLVAPGALSESLVCVMRLSADLTQILQTTFLGGGGTQGATALALGPDGSVYVTGTTTSADFPGVVGPFTIQRSDAFVARLGPQLTDLRGAILFGGEGSDQPTAILHTTGGNLVVVGATDSRMFPPVSGALQGVFGGGSRDIFAANVAGDLSMVNRITYLGGSSNDGQSLVTNGGPLTIAKTRVVEVSGGDLVIASVTSSNDFPGTAGGLQSNLRGGYDVVLSRVSEDLGTLYRSTYLGGNGAEGLYLTSFGIQGELSLTASGTDLYVLTQTDSDDFPGVQNGFQPTRVRTSVAAVARLSPDLQTLHGATYLQAAMPSASGFATDAPYDIVWDNSDVVVVLRTTSCDWPATAVGAQSTCSQSFQTSGGGVVLSRLSADLSQLSQSTFLGPGTPSLIELDGLGNLLVAGWTWQCNHPGFAGGAQSRCPPNPSGTVSNDSFVTTVTRDLRGCTENAECVTASGGGPIFRSRFGDPTVCDASAGTCHVCLVDADCGVFPCRTSTCMNREQCVSAIAPVGTPCGDGATCDAQGNCQREFNNGGVDPNGDEDNDGILNGVECTALINCPDTDGDNTPDYLDSDDDGDSVPTNLECPNPSMCLNTDGDPLPNYLDTDDDGDGISTADEVADGLIHGSDIDLDGVPNYLSTDSDRDGSSDRIEGRNNSPNSIPAYLDVNFLGGGGIAGGALRCSFGTQQSSPQWLFLVGGAMGLMFVRRRRWAPR